MAVGRLFLLSMLGMLLVSFVHGKTLASSNTVNDVLANEKGKATLFKDDATEDPLENFVDSFAESENPESVEDVVEEIEDALEEAAEEDVKDPLELDLAGLDKNELLTFLDLDDRLLLAQIDEHVLSKTLAKNAALYTAPGGLRRKKRIVPLLARGALVVGRHLARRFARSGVTRSGSRVTRHYNGRGNYGDAVRDFNRMRPSNVRNFNNGRISGQTGTLGNSRVTVRNGSSGSNSRPTLEIQSRGGSLRRKFRYNN